MNLSPIINGQFIDPQGEPYSCGLVWTYANLSNIPQVTYKDPDGNEAHDNPIVLNSLGMPPAPVFLKDGPYSFTRHDCTGLQIGARIDNILGIVGVTSGDLPNVKLEGLTAPGTQTYAVKVAKYWDYGNLRKFRIFIVLSAKGEPSGDLIVSGLGKKNLNTTNNYSAVTVGAYKFDIGSFTQLSGLIPPNADYVVLMKNGSNVSNARLTEAGLLNDSEISLWGEYETALG